MMKMKQNTEIVQLIHIATLLFHDFFFLVNFEYHLKCIYSLTMITNLADSFECMNFEMT